MSGDGFLMEKFMWMEGGLDGWKAYGVFGCK